MLKYAVVKSGGKQYLVKEGQELVVDRMEIDKGKKTDLETLMVFTDDAKTIELGTPALKSAVSAEVIDHVKGEKVRIAKFKAKVRYRKVRGFRAQLTKIRIVSI